MFKKTAASVLHYILYRPNLVLILLLVTPAFVLFNGPKTPPIRGGIEVRAQQSVQKMAGGVCTPGAQRSHCVRSLVGGPPCHFYSCETCGSDGKWWGRMTVSGTPCAVPTLRNANSENATADEYRLAPWAALYGDADEP